MGIPRTESPWGVHMGCSWGVLIGAPWGQVLRAKHLSPSAGLVMCSRVYASLCNLATWAYGTGVPREARVLIYAI